MQVRTNIPTRLVLGHVPLRSLTAMLVVEVLVIGAGIITFFVGDMTVAVVLFVLSMIVGTLTFFLFLRIYTMEFDRTTGQMTLGIARLAGRQETQRPLTDIRAVDIDPSPVTADPKGHRVVLHMRDGTRLHLHEDPLGKAVASHAADLIAGWLRASPAANSPQ